MHLILYYQLGMPIVHCTIEDTWSIISEAFTNISLSQHITFSALCCERMFTVIAFLANNQFDVIPLQLSTAQSFPNATKMQDIFTTSCFRSLHHLLQQIVILFKYKYWYLWLGFHILQVALKDLDTIYHGYPTYSS